VTHVDPDIQAEWDAARAQLAALLRPWVQDHAIPGIVEAFVTGHMATRGWRPPLRPAPTWKRT
jgi:hypothetical protein